MEKNKIDRINELYRLSTARTLTFEEKNEQLNLRREYLAEIKLRFRNTLENTTVVYPDGSSEKLKHKEK